MNENEIFNNCKDLPEPLTKEETYRLFKRAYNGDKIAREKIAYHNIKLVLNQVMKKFGSTDYEKSELAEIGCIGLVKAINTFDISKGIEFSTYALPCINNEIKNFIIKGKKRIKSRSFSELVTICDNDTSEKLEDTVSDGFSIEEDYGDKYLKKFLRTVIEYLPEKEKKVILSYFGFDGNKPLTLAEIAKRYNLSISWAGVLLNRAVLKIEKKLKETGMIEENVGNRQKKKVKL